MKNKKYLKEKYQKINRLIDLKQFNEARKVTEEAIKEVPDDYKLHNLLCSLLLVSKENEKVIDLANHSIKNIKKDAVTFFYLGQAHWGLNKKEDGILNVINSLKIDPDLEVGYVVLTKYLLNTPSLSIFNKDSIQEILISGIDKGFLRIIDNELLILKLYFDHFLSDHSIKFLEVDPKIEIKNKNLKAFIEGIFNNDLFLMLLESIPVTLEILEKYLSEIRKKFLKEVLSSSEETINTKNIISLAQQSLRNGHSWTITDDEGENLKKIECRIKKNIKENKILNENEIAILASYKHLLNYPEIEKYLLKKNNKKLKIHSLVNNYIVDIAEEIKILGTVKELNIKSKEDNKSSFQSFTRPVGYNFLKDTNLVNFIRNNLKPAQILEKEIEITNPKILILGENSVAKSFFYRGIKGSKIDVLDENKSRLAYATRIANKNKIKNINFFKGGLEDIEFLKDKYDLIDSYRGLNFSNDINNLFGKLCAYLKPGGFMRLELISEKEFSLTESLQKHVKNKDPENIGDIRKYIREIEDEEIKLFVTKKNFYDGNLLKEKIKKKIVNFLSLEECNSLIEKQNLRFLGWSRIVDPYFRNSFFLNYNKIFKDDIIYNKLQNWIHFEKKYPFEVSDNYSFWLKKET